MLCANIQKEYYDSVRISGMIVHNRAVIPRRHTHFSISLVYTDMFLYFYFSNSLYASNSLFWDVEEVFALDEEHDYIQSTIYIYIFAFRAWSAIFAADMMRM